MRKEASLKFAGIWTQAIKDGDRISGIKGGGKWLKIGGEFY
jgi:hypothetical protein